MPYSLLDLQRLLHTDASSNSEGQGNHFLFGIVLLVGLALYDPLRQEVILVKFQLALDPRALDFVIIELEDVVVGEGQLIDFIEEQSLRIPNGSIVARITQWRQICGWNSACAPVSGVGAAWIDGSWVAVYRRGSGNRRSGRCSWQALRIR